MDPSGLFRIRDIPYLKFGIRDFKAKSGRDSGLKVYARDEMPKITIGVTYWIHGLVGREYED